MSVLNLPEEESAATEQAAAEDAEAAASGAVTLYAVVNPDGSLARGLGAVSSQKLATGQYEVIFNRNVRQCAYVATIGLAGALGSSNPGEVTVVGRFNNERGVFLTTHSSGGAPADLGFHLGVLCRP